MLMDKYVLCIEYFFLPSIHSIDRQAQEVEIHMNNLYATKKRSI